ncbi:hypothetical protein SCP_1303330 [Sparassis crispa]|uniref:Secreted protein n=1 Tax=Sparassis crispa TaxID=139825 RepID=A0A401H250_9APHY|nr:hypothetical protein SCP_1303330 [Sparassis crispa]GBE88517.1 hypothetical protein SCP_1303330 [Sparassis crispa]
MHVFGRWWSQAPFILIIRFHLQGLLAVEEVGGDNGQNINCGGVILIPSLERFQPIRATSARGGPDAFRYFSSYVPAQNFFLNMSLTVLAGSERLIYRAVRRGLVGGCGVPPSF